MRRSSFNKMIALKNLALILAAALPLGNAAPAPAPEQVNNQPSEVIPGKYIVTLNSGTADSDFEAHLSWVSDVHARSLTRRDTAGVEKTFNISDFSAYSGAFDDATIEQIKNDPAVSQYARSASISKIQNNRLILCSGRNCRAGPDLAYLCSHYPVQHPLLGSGSDLSSRWCRLE